VTDQEELKRAAAAFLAAAFDSLREDNVIPTPTYYPWVTIGRDYFGPALRAVDEQHDLEQTLERVYSQRFEERENDPRREFASTYVYGLLDAAVARCGRSGDFATDSPAVKDSIEELTTLLDADGEELVCCRVVSHLTADAAPLQLGAVTVLPEASGRRDQAVLIAKEIPAAPLAYNRDPPFAYDPPQSVLLIGGRAEAGSVYEVSQTLSQRLDRFLLCVRLLSAATVRSLYELRGARTLCSAHSPQLLSFAGEGLAMGIQRQAQLDGSETPAIEAIADLVEAAEVKRKGLAMHSLDVAIAKFQAASREVSPYERLVDLATALEATLLGGEAASEGLSLRLCSRAAALLATENDPGEAIFEDVKRLYALRSTLVHGGVLKTSRLRTTIASISTVPAQTPSASFADALGHAVDRLCDLVRRSILARLSLAHGPEPLWSFDKQISVDALLADDATRLEWRRAWRARLAELGAASAAERAPGALGFFSAARRR
jgi:hypothetical protein